MDARRTHLLDINFIMYVPKLRYRAHAPKIDPSPAFHKFIQA